MATYTDSNGIHYILADTSLQSNSQAWLAEVARTVVRASDLDDVANYYRQWFGVNWAPRAPGALITAADHNELRQAIVDGMDGAWKADLPPVKQNGDVITGLTWGPATPTFTATSYEFNTPGTYRVWAPPGATVLVIDQMIGAGGAGGHGSETENGWAGGSGGSGGYRATETYQITSKQWITIGVGAPGNGNAISNGGDTYIQTANATIVCTGGGAGGGANGMYNGYGGAAGVPNGNTGTHGWNGTNGRSSGDGPNGADSQMGQGGHGGNPWAGAGQGYGSGGGGGGFRDRTAPWGWFGADGAPGYCRITLMNANEANVTGSNTYQFVYDCGGTWSYTIPRSAKTLTIQNLVSGGGGGGGADNNPGARPHGGNGASGGIIRNQTLDITPYAGKTLIISVGRGGLAGTVGVPSSGNGTDGSATSLTVDGTVLVSLPGGGGGTYNNVNNNPYTPPGGNSDGNTPLSQYFGSGGSGTGWTWGGLMHRKIVAPNNGGDGYLQFSVST